MKPVRVLVVDDSPTMQKILCSVLELDPEIEVAGIANEPFEAREKIKALDPDVITLDLEMPNMDGLEFLEKIMRLRPMPVVVISSYTKKGAEVSFAALRTGAVGILEKPRIDDENAYATIREYVRSAGRCKQKAEPFGNGADLRLPGKVPLPAKSGKWKTGPQIIALGASTGGIQAIETVLAAFPQNCPPTLITQHLPAQFTNGFADRLNQIVAPNVREAHDSEPLKPGTVYIAPGTHKHLQIFGDNPRFIRLTGDDPVCGHRPSVDVMFNSLAKLNNTRIAAALLTGMGEDGASGLGAIRKNGGLTLAQNEQSCVIYGMPGSAVKLGAAEQILPIEEIAGALLAGVGAGDTGAELESV